MNAPVRLFCFPFAGGTAASYRSWSAQLPSSIEVRAVELPGHGARLAEPLASSWQGLLTHVADELRPELRAPFAFWGHSFGAAVAFHLAHALRDRGLPEPVHLFVAARSPPGVRVRPVSRNRLPDHELLRELEQLGGTPPEILAAPEMLQMFLPVLRADFQLGDREPPAPSEPLACPISCFSGAHDPIAPTTDMRGWRDHTDGTWALVELDTGHFFLESAAPRVLERVSAALIRT